jgi:hypothetical protein
MPFFWCKKNARSQSSNIKNNKKYVSDLPKATAITTDRRADIHTSFPATSPRALSTSTVAIMMMTI